MAINVANPNYNPQAGALPTGGIQVANPTPSASPAIASPQQIPTQTDQAPAMGQNPSMGQNSAPGATGGTTPQYITSDQAKQMVLGAQSKGLDPNTLLQTLVNNGYIIQGLNDQQYQLQQGQGLTAGQAGDSGQSQGIMGSIGSALGNFGKGILKGIGSVGEAGKQVLDTISTVGGLFPGAGGGKDQTQLLDAHGTAQSIGKFAGQALPYIGAGIATGGASAPLSLEIAAQGATGALATQGGIGDRAGAAAAAGVLGPVANKFVIGPLLSKATGTLAGRLTGNAGAVDAAGNIIKSTSDYWDAATEKLVGGAKSLAPDVTVNMAKNGETKVTSVILQKLAASGLPQEVINKVSGDMTAADIQSVSSGLNKLASGMRDGANKDTINILNNQFREWATKSLNNAKPGEQIGNQLEALYSDASKQYTAYNNLDKVLKGNLTSADPSALIKTLTSMGKDPNDKIILQNALKDYLTKDGADLSSDVKAAQYTNKLKPAAKAAFKTILTGAGFGSLYEAAKHFGL